MQQQQDGIHVGQGVSRRRLIATALLGWLTMIGFDFFLHAGLLAKLYMEPSPFLLPPSEAFALIPFGYLSFLLADVLLLWLMVRLRLRGWYSGFGFGLVFGAMIWASFALGLLSISTISLPLLAGWFLGQTLELALGGAVIGAGLARTGFRKLGLVVAAVVIGLFILTIGLQTLGLAPSVRL